MPLLLEAIRFDAVDPVVPAEFWAAVLGRDVVAEPGGALLPGSETQVGLRFVASSTRKSGTNPTHLHLTSVTADDQQRTVDTVLNLGGRHVDVGQTPEDTHIVLADPEGNEFCVMAAGDLFLAGTGLLGEVTCHGSRDVGLFWRDVLRWPLVWDPDEETAVQSPLGGTKVSWGGEPVDPTREQDRQSLDLITADLSAEVQRLATLGATLLGERQGVVDMADPDGYEFRVHDP